MNTCMDFVSQIGHGEPHNLPFWCHQRPPEKLTLCFKRLKQLSKTYRSDIGEEREAQIKVEKLIKQRNDTSKQGKSSNCTEEKEEEQSGKEIADLIIIRLK